MEKKKPATKKKAKQTTDRVDGGRSTKGKGLPQVEPKREKLKGTTKAVGTVMPTAEQKAARVAFVETLLSRGYSKRDVKAALYKHCQLGPRGCEEYLSRARKNLLLRVNEAREVHRAESFAFYESIKGDQKATKFERMRAQKEIDDLLGLRADKRFYVEHDVPVASAVVESNQDDDDNVDVNFNEVVKSMTTEEIRKLQEARRMLRTVIGSSQGNVIDAISVT